MIHSLGLDTKILMNGTKISYIRPWVTFGKVSNPFGYLLVNISDVYSNAKWSTDRGWLEICNPMNDYLSKIGTYQGCIGMEIAKDPIVVEHETPKPMKVLFGRKSHLKIKKIRNLENLFGYGKNN